MTTTPASDPQITPRRGHPIVIGTWNYELGWRIFIIDRTRKAKQGIFLPATDNSATFTNNALADIKYINETCILINLSALQVPAMNLESCQKNAKITIMP